MSEFYERFTEFPELIDYRQDQYREVMNTLNSLKNIETNDPNEVLSLINSLNPTAVSRRYQSRCDSHRRGNRELTSSIRNISFRHCKRIMGSNTYV